MLIFISFICLLASGDSTDSAFVTCLFNVLLKWPIWWRLHSLTKQPIFTLNYFAVNFLLHRILSCCNSNILLLILFAVGRESWLFFLLSILMCKVGVPSCLSLSWQVILSVSGGTSVVAFLQLLLSGSKTCVQNELLTGAVLGERTMSCVT